MRSKQVRDLVLKISEGLIASSTDLVLYLFFLTSTSFLKSYSPRGIYEAFTEADEAINQINYRTIKNALNQIKRNGLLTHDIRITREGYRRIKEIVPHYDEKRVWDKRIYLITYDIPTNHNRDRDLLREYLRRVGCTSLQESVWLTLYNPKKILADFADEKNIYGTILVSDLGHDGNIGDTDLKNLIRSVYKLDQLNEEYLDFIDKYSANKKFSPAQVAFDFFHLLRYDPQLPFELLPKNWQGNRAYQLFRKLTKIPKR